MHAQVGMTPRYSFVNTAFRLINRPSIWYAGRFQRGTCGISLGPQRWLKTSMEYGGPDSANATVSPVSTEGAPRRVRKGDKLDLKFTELAYGGGSVAYIPADEQYAEEDVGMPVYGPKGACPGELIQCVISKVRRRENQGDGKAAPRNKSLVTRSYAEAYFIKQLQPSPHAVSVPCSHFGNYWLGPPAGGCGGCSSLHVPYAMQLAEKQRQIESLFSKLSAQDFVVEPIISCKNTLQYRNKMEFTFGRRWYQRNATDGTGITQGPGEHEYTLGLHAPQRFDKVIQIEECFLQHPIGNEIIQYIRKRSSELLLEPYDTKMGRGYLRSVILRTSTNSDGRLEVMVNFTTSPCDVPGRLVPLAQEIKDRFSSVTCVLQSIRGVKSHYQTEDGDERLLAGNRDYIEQYLCGQVYRISANSFFQTNAEQAQILYEQVSAAACLTGTEIVLDLFCGTGTIGLSLASQAGQVFGIDSSRSAVLDARKNAKNNCISNATFHQGDLDKLRQTQQDSPIPDPDVVIVDPPRAGLHKDLLRFIANSNAKRVVYVSCNPLSQVRDIQQLQDLARNKYQITRVQAVDMFPNTHHVETVCSLEAVSDLI